VLALHGVSKLYGPKVVLDAVSLTINRADRIGLVGENGAGKTTLAAIILGLLAPDGGTVKPTPGLHIGYLPQEAQIEETTSIQAYLERAHGDLVQIKADLIRLEALMAEPALAPEALSAILAQYGALQDRFMARGGYEADTTFTRVLAGLSLAHLDRSRPMTTLSGGEKTRVQLAALLLGQPGLLILDEPTNHLDFAAIDWLENYLRSYTGAVLAISHDRRFLNQVVTQIAELTAHDHHLTVYHGNYDAFIHERAQQRSKQQALFDEQQAEMKVLRQQIKAKTHNIPTPPPMPDNDKMLYNAMAATAQATRAKLIARDKQRLRTLEENTVERPTRRWQINPDFNPAELGSREVIKLAGVTVRFGDRTLIEAVDAIVEGGERVILQGPNGLGKTTLLRAILGLVPLTAGSIRIARGARIGYLDQEQETLRSSRTVLEEFSQGLDLPETDLRGALHKYGLFKEEQVFQPISTLSIGQRRKLQIARLIAINANTLLLDEPTNHLDPESVEQFERALQDFPGTIVATSHDRLFIERVGTQVWTFEAAHLVRVR
jgi:macrolide transport system ATP-binding/permease protein